MAMRRVLASPPRGRKGARRAARQIAKCLRSFREDGNLCPPSAKLGVRAASTLAGSSLTASKEVARNLKLVIRACRLCLAHPAASADLLATLSACAEGRRLFRKPAVADALVRLLPQRDAEVAIATIAPTLPASPGKAARKLRVVASCAARLGVASATSRSLNEVFRSSHLEHRATVKRNALTPAKRRRLLAELRPKAWTHVPPSRWNSASLYELLSESPATGEEFVPGVDGTLTGRTVTARALACRTRAAMDLAQEAESAFPGFAAGVHMYATAAGAQGLQGHRDDHTVVVLQLRGSKRWRVIAPEHPEALLPPVFSSPGACALAQGSAISTVTRPGDALVIPRGFWHRAESCEGESSLHLTLALELFPPFTFAGVLHIASAIGRAGPGTHALLVGAIQHLMGLRERAPFEKSPADAVASLREAALATGQRVEEARNASALHEENELGWLEEALRQYPGSTFACGGVCVPTKEAMIGADLEEGRRELEQMANESAGSTLLMALQASKSFLDRLASVRWRHASVLLPLNS